MNMQIGLKLWSTNTDYYYEEAKKLYDHGYFDYIELYVVPNTLDKINKWKQLAIPFILHAPHFAHNVNLANPHQLNFNKQIYNEVKIFQNILNTEYIIIHAGMDGNIEETIRQLKIINPKNILIENKPLIPPLCQQKRSVGAYLEEIHKITSELDCGFCLDISHAICTANAINKEPYAYLSEFQKLNPAMYHLSDGIINSFLDQHLHFGNGTYNFKKIFSIINKNKFISIETMKNNKKNINDFIKDIQWINAL